MENLDCGCHCVVDAVVDKLHLLGALHLDVVFGQDAELVAAEEELTLKRKGFLGVLMRSVCVRNVYIRYRIKVFQISNLHIIVIIRL